jgi:Fic/DOC family
MIACVASLAAPKQCALCNQIRQVARAAIAHLCFESIHPSEDGNGVTIEAQRRTIALVASHRSVTGMKGLRVPDCSPIGNYGTNL